RLQSRLQTRWRHPYREAGDELAVFDERRVGRRMAVPQSVPLRRKLTAHRHRTPVIALRHRTLRQREIHADGVSSRKQETCDTFCFTPTRMATGSRKCFPCPVATPTAKLVKKLSNE